jgi:hypothetical protein
MKRKAKRISFSVEAELAERMRSAASKEPIPTNLADFTRKLVGWAWPHYRVASSLWLLRQATVKVPKLIGSLSHDKRRQEEAGLFSHRRNNRP